MNMDTARGRIFGLTWPTGRFFRFDLARNDLKDFGPVRELGESGRGTQLSHDLPVDRHRSRRWFGLFHRLGGHDPSLPPAADAVEIVAGDDLRKDYFGLYDPTSPGHMGYNWRQVVWVPSRKIGLRRARQLRLPVPVRPAWPNGSRSLTASPRSRRSALGCSTSSATATSASHSGPMAGRCTT